MIKYLQLFFVVLFPYLIVLFLTCMFSGIFIDILIILVVLIVFYILALISVGITFIISLTRISKLLEVHRVNMIMKLILIPAYLFIFMVGFLCMITIFTFGLTIVLMILDVMIIVLTGLIGLGSIIKSLMEKKITTKKAVMHGILQFVFCADIVSAIVMYKGVKKDCMIVQALE